MATTPQIIEQPAEWVTSPSHIHSIVTKREQAMFDMGKQKGVEEYKQKHKDLLDANFLKSYEDTSKILQLLSEMKIDVISARLKVETLTNLRIALSVEYSDALIENLEKIYNYLHELEVGSNSENYIIDFSLIKANGQFFSDKCVENDGFIYKHGLLVNEKETRPAQS